MARPARAASAASAYRPIATRMAARFECETASAGCSAMCGGIPARRRRTDPVAAGPSIDWHAPPATSGLPALPREMSPPRRRTRPSIARQMPKFRMRVDIARLKLTDSTKKLRRLRHAILQSHERAQMPQRRYGRRLRFQDTTKLRLGLGQSAGLMQFNRFLKQLIGIDHG